MRVYRALLLILMLPALLGACASRVPTVAHTHVGHALDGWVDTPGERGLLAVARAEARIAREHAAFAVAGGSNVAEIKLHLGHVLHALDPAREASGPGQGYGLVKAIDGAVRHLLFAAEAPDASENLRSSVLAFSRQARKAIGDARLMVTLAETARASGDAAEVLVFAEELSHQARDVEAQLGALREQIDAATDREDPVYQPVERWYLFNLIRLPSGDWIFRDRNASSSGNSSGY